MIEKHLARLSYNVWVKSGQQALDLVQGAHVRRFEQVREEYYLSNLDPALVGHPPKRAGCQIAGQQKGTNRANTELATQSKYDKEQQACTLAKWRVQDLLTSSSGLPPHLKAKLSQLVWRFDDERATSAQPMLVTDVMQLTQDYVESKARHEPGWLRENFSIIASEKISGQFV